MRKIVVVAVAAAAWPVAALAQDSATVEDEPEMLEDSMGVWHAPSESQITIVASGDREYLMETGSRISVFTRGDIEDVQGPDIARLLQRAPGVSWSRNGPPGAFTGVRIRGSQVEQVLVLLDGVRMADVAAPSGGFDFGSLAMGNIAKVEVQRGSNSTIWGSDAIGGVISLSSFDAVRPALREFEDEHWGLHGAVEYGARDALYATAAASGQAGPLTMALNGGWASGDGFSAAASGSEADGYRQGELQFASDLRFSDAIGAFLVGRYGEGRTDTDGFPAPDYVLADTGEFQKARQLSGAAGFNVSLSPLLFYASFSQTDTERENHDPALGLDPSYATDGTGRLVEFRGLLGLSDDLDLHFGASREWLSFATLFDPRRKTATSGAYLQVDYDTRNAGIAVGLRRDGHRDFGDAWSLGADGWISPGGALRLTASYGEGFKAPSLFQLHSDYGNPMLDPERSRSLDVGIEHNGAIATSLTLFRRDSRDLIDFVSCSGTSTGICSGRPFGTYDNVGRARSQGIEVEASGRLAEDVDAALVYAFADSSNRETGRDLARRPRHAGTLTLDWQPLDLLRLGADLRVVSASWDDAANLVRLDGYATLDLRARWFVSDEVELYARIENLWDERYQTAAGYGTQGRAAHVGARVKL